MTDIIPSNSVMLEWDVAISGLITQIPGVNILQFIIVTTVALAYRILGGYTGSDMCWNIMSRYFNPLWLGGILVH